MQVVQNSAQIMRWGTVGAPMQNTYFLFVVVSINRELFGKKIKVKRLTKAYQYQHGDKQKKSAAVER